jgi:hypothetical protein
VRRLSLVYWLVGVVIAIAVAAYVFGASIAQTTVAVVVGAVLLKLGLVMIGGLAQPVPDPADPGTLRKVKLVYRCSICGAEVKMTVAASEDPEPPRHCLEDMELVTPIE